jgi:hypothetical protein
MDRRYCVRGSSIGGGLVNELRGVSCRLTRVSLSCSGQNGLNGTKHRGWLRIFGIKFALTVHLFRTRNALQHIAHVKSFSPASGCEEHSSH